MQTQINRKIKLSRRYRVIRYNQSITSALLILLRTSGCDREKSRAPITLNHMSTDMLLDVIDQVT